MAKKAVVIPACNEQSTLRQVVGRVPLEYAVIVVDDGSTDGTWKEIEEIRQTSSNRELFALRNESNLGAGNALKKGLALAVSKEFDEIFCIDADGQHPPEKLDELSAALQEGFDCAFASRFLDKHNENGSTKTPFLREWGNKFFALKTNFLFGAHYTDVLCGMRGFRREALEKLLPQMREERYGNALEVACLAGMNRLKVKEIPIPQLYFSGRKHGYSIHSMLSELLATLIKTFFRNVCKRSN